MTHEKLGERLIPGEITTDKEYVNYILHNFSYLYALSMCSHDTIILDVGCGAGYGAFLLSQRAQKVIGIDIDANIINLAHKKYGKKIELILFDSQKIPYRSGLIDIVLSFQVIEHISDVDQLLVEVKRILKPGGTFYVSTPNRVYRLRPGQKPWNIYHLREYDFKGLETTLQRIFENVQIQGISGSTEIKQIEINRVKMNKLLATLDFLNLRTRLNDKLKIKFGNIISKMLHASDDLSDDIAQRIIADDLFLMNENLNNSLHLFATCKKTSD